MEELSFHAISDFMNYFYIAKFDIFGTKHNGRCYSRTLTSRGNAGSWPNFKIRRAANGPIVFRVEVPFGVRKSILKSAIGS